jgi:Xaa-Pro aminopeptidase
LEKLLVFDYQEVEVKNNIQNVNINNKTLYEEVKELRYRKTKDEIEILQKINKISINAHLEVMRISKPGIKEYQLQAVFQSYLLNHNIKHNAYLSIIGGGTRSAILHYNTNDKEVNDGELLLIDAGGELDLYASDITRTFPINGKFSKKQRDIYTIVLSAQKEVIKNMKPGVKWSDMHLLAYEIIAKGLIEVGILKGELKEVLESDVVALFFPHGIGHSLGSKII